jgi:lethal(2) giant larvae protein
VRDHLNSTVTTLCSQTTEEIIGRLSVLSTTTNNTATSLKPKEVLDVKTLKETVAGETNETHQNSVIVKSVITTISHGAGATNGDAEKTTTTTITRKESQF